MKAETFESELILNNNTLVLQQNYIRMNQMKRVILWSFCALLSFSAQAQSDWKTSAGWEFAPIGAKWCYFDRDIRGIVGDGFILMECVKDTLFSDLPMRKITRNRVDIYRDGADPTFTYMDCFYVHCKGDSVYVRNPETGTLDLLYIFNAQPGDTLALVVPYYARYAFPGEAFRICIEDITVKDMGGVPVNAYHYRGLDGVNYDLYNSQYFDYAGSSLFFPVSVLPTAGDHFLLSYFDPIVGRLQFEDKERYIWDFPWDVYPWDIEDCLMGEEENYPWGIGNVSGEAASPEAEVRYFPDEKRITVELPMQGGSDCRTALFTEEGAKVLEFSGESADLSSLPAGIYLVQVRSGKDNAVLSTGKIAVR